MNPTKAKIFKLAALSTLGSLTCSSGLTGIPEPGAIFYGRVENTAGVALPISSISWSITEPGTGKIVELSVGSGIELVSHNSETWYVARVGFETTAVDGFEFDSPAPNTFALSENPVNFNRSAVVVNNQAVLFKSPAAPSFTLPETASPTGARSRLERVDLVISVNTQALYQAWIGVYYPLNDPRSGPNQDPDKDGINNLMERALGLDPTKFSALPVSTGTVNVANKKYFTYTFRYPNDRPDTPLVPEISEDLSSWNSGPDFLIEMENVLIDQSRRITVRDTSPIVSFRKAYLRLRVVE